MNCKAVATGKVKCKGKASLEFYKDGKPRYYCYGYIDKMTDDIIPECRECRKHVDHVMEDFERMKQNENHQPYTTRN